MAASDPRKDDENAKQPKPAEAVDATSLPVIDLGQEGMVDLGELSMDQDGSAVPLAHLPEPPSGQSLTSWTEVIRRQREAQADARPTQGVDVDAPSDRDLLGRVNAAGAGGEGRPKASGDTSEIHPADLPVYTVLPGNTNSESDIDLGQQPTPGAVGGSEVRFDILYPPSDAGGAMPLPSSAMRIPPPDFRTSGALPGDDEEIPFGTASGTGVSGVELGASSGPISEAGRSSILDVLLRESGGGLPPPVAKTTMPELPERRVVPTQPGIDLSDSISPVSDSDLDLTGPASSFGSDDAVNIHAGTTHPPSITDSGTLEISEEAMAESQRQSEQSESSSIDMNSRPSMSGSDFDVQIQPPLPGTLGSDADIDLSLPPVEDESDSSMIAKRGILEENQEQLAAEFEARRKRTAEKDAGKKERAKPARREVVPARDDEVPAAHRRGYLLHGGVIGLLLGAGGVLAAYFGGALPNRGSDGAKSPPADNSANVAQLRQEADAAKKKEADALAAADAIRKSIADAGIDPDKVGESVKQLADAKTASDNRANSLATEAQKAKNDLLTARQEASDAKVKEETAKKALADADKAATDAKAAEATAKKALADADKAAIEAKKNLDNATKAIETAKAETAAVKKAAEDALKLADAKLVEATKREADLVKANETANKAAADAQKSRDASDSLVKSITERLAKAKFVGEKPDAVALVKGLDDAIKAGSADATATLRGELAKSRDSETKSRAEAAAAREKEIAATKQVATLQADMQKLTAESTKLKADVQKLSKDATDANAKAVAAERTATQAKVSAEQLAAEAAELKSSNERLTRELNTVKELAELVRSQAGSSAFASKPDPAKFADRFFADGVRSYHAGQYPSAAAALRKAIQLRHDDARYHYLLGLTLWMADDRDAAKAEFEKGRDLEMEARPPSRMISSELEKIQGPARHAMNAYRP